MAKRVKRLMSRADVIAFLGISESTLDRLIEAGHFPPAASVSPQVVGWFEKDIVAFLYLRGRGCKSKADKPAAKGAASRDQEDDG